MIGFAEQMVNFIKNNHSSSTSATADFDDELRNDSSAIVDDIKQLLPNCEVLEVANDYIIISYETRMIRIECEIR
jgi:hypothetical protein